MYQPIYPALSEDPRSVLDKNERVNNQQETRHDEPLEPQRRPSGEKSGQKPQQLSLLLKLSILLSLLSITAAITFISWLWWTPHEDNRWRAWVLAPNRLQLSITLASIVIRTAVGTIATVATAMVASVAAEQRGIHLHAVSQVSVARFSNSGPLSLGLLTLRGSGLGAVVRLIVALLILTTLAAQFTSTLLVSDFELSQVSSFPRIVPNVYGFGGDFANWTLSFSDHDASLISGDDLWRQVPRLAETFAEYSREPLAVDGLDDTGSTVRAFLPMASQEARESLLEFRGTAWLMDSRIMCMRPELKDVRLCDDRTVCGSVRVESSVAEAAGLSVTEKDVYLDFRCLVEKKPGICLGSSAYFDDTETEWNLAANFTEHRAGTIMELLWDPTNIYFKTPHYLTGNATVQNSIKRGSWTEYVFRVKDASYKGEKLDTETELAFNMTMCARFHHPPRNSIRQLNISASSLKSRSEPAWIWDVNKGSYNTSSVRRQLGAVRNASSISTEDRQILLIDRESFESSLAEIRSGRASYNQDWGVQFAWEWAQPLGPMPQPSDIGRLDNRFYMRLFNETLRETGSPARALQAIYFTCARVSYYHLMIAFTPNTETPGAATAEIVTSERTQVPRNRRGYWAVVGVLAVFLATSAAVAALFRSTRYSIVNNSWHTVAQIAESEELVELLREAKLATDDEVERLIEGSSETISPPPSGAGPSSYVKDVILRAFRVLVSSLASLFTSGGAGKAQRFVIRDGVFVRASGVSLDVELEENVSRRRLTRKDSNRETLDGRCCEGQNTLHAPSQSGSRSGSPEGRVLSE